MSLPLLHEGPQLLRSIQLSSQHPALKSSPECAKAAAEAAGPRPATPEHAARIGAILIEKRIVFDSLQTASEASSSGSTELLDAS